MKIAVVQLNYTVGAVKLNKFKIIEQIYAAKEKGADLVVFAEHAISGTNCYDLINNVQFLESCEVALVEIASHCDDISVIVGLPILDGTKKVSSAVLIQNRRIIKYIGKQNISSRNEKIFFEPSTGCGYVNVAGKRIVVLLGDDMIIGSKLGNNSDLVVAIGADPYFRSIIETRYSFVKYFSYINNKPVVFVNHLGGQSETIYDGSSCVFRNGEPIAFLKSFEEDVQVVDLENAPVIKEFPEQDKDRNIYNAICLGLSDYFSKNGFTKACLGMSGGIDSALVLALAVDVLGADNVRILMMPSMFSSEHSISDSIEMAENLGVRYEVIPITDTYNTLKKSLEPITGGTQFDVTEENMQARIRCNMLMALSNKFGYVLLNTSNKSEASMGYGTLYGDLAGSLSVIGDLYKSEVYSLARYMNRRMTVIPENIINKEPSAELRPGQKDSDGLPPYEVMDAILFRLLEEGQGIDEIVNAGFDRDMVKFILKKIKNFEFKRRQSPPALRLSLRPYGSGYVLPLINNYVEW